MSNTEKLQLQGSLFEAPLCRLSWAGMSWPRVSALSSIHSLVLFPCSKEPRVTINPMHMCSLSLIGNKLGAKNITVWQCKNGECATWTDPKVIWQWSYNSYMFSMLATFENSYLLATRPAFKPWKNKGNKRNENAVKDLWKMQITLHDTQKKQRKKASMFEVPDTISRQIACQIYDSAHLNKGCWTFSMSCKASISVSFPGCVEILLNVD